MHVPSNLYGVECEICGDQANVDDHCHRRGRRKGRRGPLCQQCNSMLGFARDDPDILRAGADYLEEYEVIIEHKEEDRPEYIGSPF